MEMHATDTADMATLVHEALRRSAAEVRSRLVDVQAELDEIGPTFGMEWRRTALNREKNELLDQLLGLRCAAA
jgi:hypothetical protein